MVSSLADRYSRLVTCLGGPPTDVNEIEWATDVPSGKALMEWATGQMAGGPHDPIASASLRRIALEEEEVRIFRECRALGLDRLEESEPGNGSAGCYHTPSALHAKSANVSSHISLIGQESSRLRRRLELLREASESLKKSTKHVQGALKTANQESDCHKAALTNASVEADATINQAIVAANAVLDKGLSGSNSSKQFRHRFAELTERHSQVVKIAENGASELNRVAATILSTVELEEEGSRLEEVFRSLAPVHGKARDRVGEAAYCEQLVAAYSDLNSAKSSRGSPEDILREFEAQPLSSSATDSPIRDPLEFNLGELIQSAWEMDQFALLGAKERFLDETDRQLKDLLDPLELLHRDLSDSYRMSSEREVLITALLEELEEIGDDLENAGEYSILEANISGRSITRETAGDLQAALKRNHNLRPRDAPPLVLLDGDDLGRELAGIAHDVEEKQASEAQWFRSLQEDLASLSSARQPLLAAIYANSPGNTSKPFGPVPKLVKLEADTRKQAEKLTDAIIHAPVISERTERKLDAFVTKWGSL